MGLRPACAAVMLTTDRCYVWLFNAVAGGDAGERRVQHGVQPLFAGAGAAAEGADCQVSEAAGGEEQVDLQLDVGLAVLIRCVQAGCCQMSRRTLDRDFSIWRTTALSFKGKA